MPGDAVTYSMPILNGERGYMPLPVPNLPSFLGSSIHSQAMVLNPQGQLTLTNPSELVIRDWAYLPCCFFQVSLSVTVRWNTGEPCSLVFGSQ